jgi:hypothetical protein
LLFILEPVPNSTGSSHTPEFPRILALKLSEKP